MAPAPAATRVAVRKCTQRGCLCGRFAAFVAIFASVDSPAPVLGHGSDEGVLITPPARAPPRAHVSTGDGPRVELDPDRRGTDKRSDGIGWNGTAGSGTTGRRRSRSGLDNPDRHGTYRELVGHGFAINEGANLTAYLNGLPPEAYSWTPAQVEALLFLRNRRETGLFHLAEAVVCPSRRRHGPGGAGSSDW